MSSNVIAFPKIAFEQSVRPRPKKSGRAPKISRVETLEQVDRLRKSIERLANITLTHEEFVQGADVLDAESISTNLESAVSCLSKFALEWNYHAKQKVDRNPQCPRIVYEGPSE